MVIQHIYANEQIMEELGKTSLTLNLTPALEITERRQFNN